MRAAVACRAELTAANRRRAVERTKCATDGRFNGPLDRPSIAEAHLRFRGMDVDIDSIRRKANVEEEREWQGGYEKTYRDSGRMIHERWDSTSNRGEYNLIVANRFVVEVSGQATSMDELKDALAAGVNVAGLEAAAAAQAKPES